MNWEDEELNSAPPSFSLRVWLGLARFFRPYARLLGITAALMALCTTVDVAMPLYQRYIIDRFIVTGESDGIGAAGAVGVALLLVQMASTIGFTRAAIRVEMGFSRDLKRACFDHLQTLSLSYYNRRPVGWMIARVMSDTDRIGLTLAWGLVDVMWGLSYAAFALLSMMLLDFRVGGLVALVVPPMAVATSWFQNKILRQNREVRRQNSRLVAAINEGVAGARTSKTLVNEETNIASFRRTTNAMRAGALRAATLNAAFLPVMTAFGAITVALIVVRGGAYTAAGAMEIGTLSALVSYAINIFQPVQQLARMLSEATSVQANVERVHSLLAERPEISDSPEIVERYGDTFAPKRENWEPMIGTVDFDDVTFRYDDGFAIDGLTLSVRSGQRVAIVGETGAGKSTLVNLVCRFFEPESGRILIDGRDIRERSQLWLRSHIGCVLQTPHMFSGTVRDNIRYGKPDAADDEIWQAARLVAADRVIDRLPDGLDSVIGEGGDDLSTGEKQLLSLARALVADPRIFILDEATSSIDTETEREIQTAVERVMQGRTSFIIAHRLSTIESADVILVVSNGRIVEQGTHEELLAKRGAYSEMIAAQFVIPGE